MSSLNMYSKLLTASPVVCCRKILYVYRHEVTLLIYITVASHRFSMDLLMLLYLSGLNMMEGILTKNNWLRFPPKP